jgi:hypothetical protein
MTKMMDKKTELSEAGKIKIKEALEALEKKEVKEFDNVHDLINELNS